jgi:hypothetical protein
MNSTTKTPAAYATEASAKLPISTCCYGLVIYHRITMTGLKQQFNFKKTDFSVLLYRYAA